MPFKSRSQQRLFFTKAREPGSGITLATAKAWAAHTPDMKALPERAAEKTKQAVLAVLHGSAVGRKNGEAYAALADQPWPVTAKNSSAAYMQAHQTAPGSLPMTPTSLPATPITKISLAEDLGLSRQQIEAAQEELLRKYSAVLGPLALEALGPGAPDMTGPMVNGGPDIPVKPLTENLGGQVPAMNIPPPMGMQAPMAQGPGGQQPVQTGAPMPPTAPGAAPVPPAPPTLQAPAPMPGKTAAALGTAAVPGLAPPAGAATGAAASAGTPSPHASAMPANGVQQALAGVRRFLPHTHPAGRTAGTGGGASSSHNPINAFGPISQIGEINGNAGLGVKNSPVASKNASAVIRMLHKAASIRADIADAVRVRYPDLNHGGVMNLLRSLALDDGPGGERFLGTLTKAAAGPPPNVGESIFAAPARALGIHSGPGGMFGPSAAEGETAVPRPLHNKNILSAVTGQLTSDAAAGQPPSVGFRGGRGMTLDVGAAGTKGTVQPRAPGTLPPAFTPKPPTVINNFPVKSSFDWTFGSNSRVGNSVFEGPAAALGIHAGPGGLFGPTAAEGATEVPLGLHNKNIANAASQQWAADSRNGITSGLGYGGPGGGRQDFSFWLPRGVTPQPIGEIAPPSPPAPMTKTNCFADTELGSKLAAAVAAPRARAQQIFARRRNRLLANYSGVPGFDLPGRLKAIDADERSYMAALPLQPALASVKLSDVNLPSFSGSPTRSYAGEGKIPIVIKPYTEQTAVPEQRYVQTTRVDSMTPPEYRPNIGTTSSSSGPLTPDKPSPSIL